jgi:hypothetical protein
MVMMMMTIINNACSRYVKLSGSFKFLLIPWFLGDNKTGDYVNDGEIIRNLVTVIPNNLHIGLDGPRKTTNIQSTHPSRRKGITV